MKVHFITPNRISLINLTTIGDSEKRDDSTKIGQFSSGQAYATALLLRNGVNITIDVVGGNIIERYTYSTKNRVCEITGKEKEVIVLNYTKDGITEEIETAFALQLGYNWELWMALRELYSNMIDEGGYMATTDTFSPQGTDSTIITLEFSEDNPFYDVWNKRGLYINGKQPLFTISDNVEVIENKDNYLKIYKQNILVHSDEKVPSRYAYNIKFGEIDERRLLRNVYNIEQSISQHIMQTKNEDFLRSIISKDFEEQENEFLSKNYCSWYNCSDLIHNICFDVYQQYGEVSSYYWILSKVRERKDCKIGGKKIKSVGDSIWNYSKTVTIESNPMEYPLTPEDCFMINPLQKEIDKYYNFKLDVEVKIAKLKGSKVIADKYEKCLILDNDFKVESDFEEFIVEYVDLTQDGNVVKNLSKYICKLLKK